MTPPPPCPTKWHQFLQFLGENKAFYFSKRAVRAVTVCNDWLKQALCGLHFHAMRF